MIWAMTLKASLTKDKCLHIPQEKHEDCFAVLATWNETWNHPCSFQRKLWRGAIQNKMESNKVNIKHKAETWSTFWEETCQAQVSFWHQKERHLLCLPHIINSLKGSHAVTCTNLIRHFGSDHSVQVCRVGCLELQLPMIHLFVWMLSLFLFWISIAATGFSRFFCFFGDLSNRLFSFLGSLLLQLTLAHVLHLSALSFFALESGPKNYFSLMQAPHVHLQSLQTASFFASAKLPTSQWKSECVTVPTQWAEEFITPSLATQTHCICFLNVGNWMRIICENSVKPTGHRLQGWWKGTAAWGKQQLVGLKPSYTGTHHIELPPCLSPRWAKHWTQKDGLWLVKNSQNNNMIPCGPVCSQKRFT